jgi:hypoxanthine phosphoribosyltransferase
VKDENIILADKAFEPFISKSEIKEAIISLARTINKDFEGRELIIIGVLDGAFVFLAHLVKRLKLNVQIELIKLKSYEGTRSTGRIENIIGLTTPINGKELLIIEDIIDTGQTLSHLLKMLNQQQPKSVSIATLLLKKDIFKDQFPIDYIGIDIPNKFVVGFGMDYLGEGRQLPQIYTAVEN